MAFSCEHLSKEFTTRDGIVRALEDVTLRVEDGEFVCLVGPSGCGKTTLLKIMVGLLPPTTGQITFTGTVPRNAMVFQEHGLFPWMTVLENVAFGLEMQGVEARLRRERAGALIEKVGLGAFASRYPHQLSVGMQQRVGIARAFTVEPDLLLMDEPFGALDAQTRLVLQDELLGVWTHHARTVVFVTHDIDEALRLGDRVLVMSGRPGRIREDIAISLQRPRGMSAQGDPYLSELKWRVWRMLEPQVRSGLSLPA